MNKMPFQEVFDIIEPTLPAGWKKVCVLCEYEEDSYLIKYYVQVEDGYIDCYKMPGLKQKELMLVFEKLDEVIAPARQILKQEWTTATMTIDCNGKFHCDFDYEDVSDDITGFIDNWKKKYLK